MDTGCYIMSPNVIFHSILSYPCVWSRVVNQPINVQLPRLQVEAVGCEHFQFLGFHIENRLRHGRGAQFCGSLAKCRWVRQQILHTKCSLVCYSGPLHTEKVKMLTSI